MDDRQLLSIICPVIGAQACADDCAIITRMKGTIVVSTDMLHEKTDFPHGISDWQIGWMAMAVTISDIAAMGAAPRALTLAIGLDREDRLEGIVKGAQACCTAFGATYAGGDLDSHPELTLVSTGIGEVEDGRPVERRGARPGDLIGVTGIQGRAMAGLMGDPRYWTDLCEPQPRVAEGIILRKAGVTAMMDISDGLAISLYDIAAESHVGMEISSGRIPLPPEADVQVALEAALYGGGDFELLFFISEEKMKNLTIPVTQIGRVSEGLKITMDGMELPKKGYLHHW
mgnify:CR=1 FL=1